MIQASSPLAAALADVPDLATSVDDMVVDAAASKVAVRWTAVGTNQACFLGIGPTFRRTRITGIEIIEFSGKLIIRRWGEWDVSDHSLTAGPP